jgi:hypothetical protein
MLEDPEVKEEKRTKNISFKFRDNIWKRFVNSVVRKRNKRRIQQFTNLIYNTQFQKVNVLSILKDISMNIVKF